MVEKKEIIQAFSALAHEARLEVFTRLVQAGPDGLSAGDLAKRLGIAANALSFHLTRLRHAGLVHPRRAGKQIIYSADYAEIEGLLGFLTDNCCRDSARACSTECADRQEPQPPVNVKESA